MKLVVGLGNPGTKYRATRHNVGFDVNAQIARNQPAAGPVVSKFQGEIVEYGSAPGRMAPNRMAPNRMAHDKVILLCPSTYMNRSGSSVRQAFDFYKLELGDVLVVCDDLNLPVGRLRYRPKGSAGGQKGLADIIRHLGSDEIPRLRIGIGPVPPRWDAADFVLGRFSEEERDVMDAAVQRAARSVEDWVEKGIDHCMNQYNRA